jgi:hypothetical protein
MDFYEALNLKPEASVEEIEQAYRQLARKVHPDFHPDENDSAETRMKMLNLIRDTLTDPERRAKYDSELRQSMKVNHRYGRATATWLASGWKQSWSNKPIAMIAVAGLLFGMTLGASFWYQGRPTIPPTTPLTNLPGTTLPSFPVNSTSTQTTPLSETPAKPAEMPSKARPQVVQIGSDLNEVLQMMGNPDRVEEDFSRGLRILHYGKLRLVLKNGKLVQGLTPP